MARRATEKNAGHSVGAAMRHVNSALYLYKTEPRGLIETPIQKRLTQCSHPCGVPDGTLEEGFPVIHGLLSQSSNVLGTVPCPDSLLVNKKNDIVRSENNVQVCIFPWV